MTNLVFLDIETTGLDPQADCILELGMVVLDSETMEVVAEESWVLAFDEARDRDPRPAITQFVVDMHTANGLWKECAEKARTATYYQSLERVQEQAIKFLELHTPDEASPMCGNTIAFDRSFLKVDMPNLESLFSHRNLDVSVLNIIAKSFPGTLEYVRGEQTEKHRVIADCYNSVTQLWGYLSQLNPGHY